LPPDSEYEFSGNAFLGAGLVIMSVAGTAYVIGNDITGIGTLDDAAVVPLLEAIRQGIIMIFK